ncbi:hypothetical protein [Flavonifractor sp. AGMB03687]|uniref:hypothetical protein n=1 Tax=Flavonifractor sp. AGMB03687 TaxID=2785133 RepID=UPI001AE0A5EA|nr:hypothetical protein [Flavonifractor sp. AGMB03687]
MSKPIRRMAYTSPMPLPRMCLVNDQAPQQPQKRDPEVERKLARVVALLEKLVNEDRPAAADVMAAKKAQRQENARRLRERNAKMDTPNDDGMTPLLDAIRRACFETECESSAAAYAMRNPHKAQQDAPGDDRLQYPHKPRQREAWEDRLATRDSGARFMTACEQAEAAYAARNPHKRRRER